MLDASVALMAKVGIPIKKTLEYLEEYFSHNELLSKGAFALKHIQREGGINPAVAYTLALYSGEIAAGSTSGELCLNIDSPAKGTFTSSVTDTDNWLFEAGTTDLALSAVMYNAAPEYVKLTFSGEAVTGEMTITAKGASLLNDTASEALTYEIE